MFQFHPEVAPKRQSEILKKVRSWKSIQAAGSLNPKAIRPELRRMCFADVEDGTDPAPVVQELLRLPEIATAAVPAQRRLLM